MSGDLISREAALMALKGVIARTGLYGVSIEVILANVPAVEAEPVVHAHWEFVDFCSPNLKCSSCGDLAPMDCCGDYHSERTKRCPHCGAHMDEEVAEDG